MASLEDFDRQVKGLTTKGKLSSSLLQGVVDAAIHNIQNDSRIISILYKHHKKASAANKLTSLYLVDGIAREARSRQKKIDREAKGKAREGPAQSPTTAAAGSTTPTLSPPAAASPAPAAASAGSGTYASFLKILEAGMLAKFVLDNWENGLPEHREKVRKVLDIWTKAATFSPSAMARVSQKLLAAGSSSTSTSTKTARVASPARPSLSPDLSPPPEAKPAASTASVTGGSTIPANVLALLQASTEAPLSQAAIEQKRQEEMQAEVERVLREAQMGGKSVSSTAYGSGPPPRSSYPASTSYAASSYPGPAPTYSTAPLASNPSSSTVPHLALDASQLAALQQIAGGLNGQAAPPPPPQHVAPSNGAGFGQRPGHGPPPPQQQQQQYQARQPASYDSPRGYTRSYDEAQHGYSNQHDGPPAKRPFQPAPPQQQQQQQHAARPPPPPQQHSPSHPSTSPYASPAAPVPVAAPSRAAPTPSPAPTSSAAPSSSFDPSTFDATSAHSWSTFVYALRSAHPFFVGRPTPPTMEEIMSLCAPSAMMAFGAGGGGTAEGQQGGTGMGGYEGAGERDGEAGQGEGPGGFAGADGGFAGAEGGY
ncbi:hypothetical protein JCM3775_000105 [Rhodotorula graminis]